jgi:hydroxymethylpyrimidine/phosphomethylpyrimidine kinase
MVPSALTIAGSDPSGGAGLQADLKTFHTHRVYGMAVPTLITVQNTHGVRRVELLSADLIAEQIAALLSDAPPTALKTGALGAAAQVRAVADALSGQPELPLVIDPVCLSKTGAELLDSAGRRELIARLLPQAILFTPNLDEAALFLGQPIEREQDIPEAARALLALGARAVLLKGGHRAGDPVDVLCWPQGMLELTAERVHTRHTHGVGCSLSAAIAARLACGHDLLAACSLAKKWLTRALASAPGIGGGQGAIDHFAPLPDASEETHTE